MNMGAYREGRVRLTDQIKGALIDLVMQEEDFKKKKKHPATWYRDQTALNLKLGEAQNPSLRSYEEALKVVRKKFQEKNPLDEPWTIGCCLKYDISPSVVIPIQSHLLQYGRFLTIRRARWYSMLHTILSPLLEKAYPGQLDRALWRFYQIASYYTRIEQVAEINGEDYPNTQLLDNTFILDQDFSPETFSRISNNLYYQGPEKPTKLADQKASAQKAEQVLAGEMTKSEAKLLNEFIELDATDLEKAITLQKANPDIQPFIDKWRALSLRRDIKISKKDGAK